MMFDLGSGYYTFEDINHTVVDVMDRLRGHWSGTPAVLDIGCGRGQIGKALGALGYRVTGIETSASALALARQRLAEVCVADLTDETAVRHELGDRRFDAILFADVLEHVADPLKVLSFYRQFLKTGGRIVISVPNIASWDRRLALLGGYFDYADTGIMDRTHLRFFTFRTAQILVREAGLTPLAIAHAPGIVRAFLPLIKRLLYKQRAEAPLDPTAILSSPAYRYYEKWILPAETMVAGLMKGLLSFRIVLVAEAREPS
jgi:SAM-dependent methyltransferase